MEDIQDILQDISAHTSEEREKKVLNKTIGRSSIELKMNGKEKTIWITNRGSKLNTYMTFTNDYRLIGERKPYTDTLTAGYSVTSKNSTWGRILLENFSGEHTCITPNGKVIDFTLHNSSSYNQFYGDVTDLVIGTESTGKRLYLGSLHAASPNYVDIIKKQMEYEAKKKAAEE